MHLLMLRLAQRLRALLQPSATIMKTPLPYICEHTSLFVHFARGISHTPTPLMLCSVLYSSNFAPANLQQNYQLALLMVLLSS